MAQLNGAFPDAERSMTPHVDGAALAVAAPPVIEGDAKALEFDSDRFSAVTAFSVLHHVPTAAEQDRILGEIFRVLAPGRGIFATDSRDLELIRDAHRDDTFVPLPIDTLTTRLEGLGFVDVDLEIAEYEIRFAARKP